MSYKYVLDIEGRPLRCDDLIAWATWFESSGKERQIAYDEIGDVQVSTVFLGLDLNLFGGSEPRIFETVVFGGSHSGTARRYATRADAERGHAEILGDVRQSLLDILR